MVTDQANILSNIKAIIGDFIFRDHRIEGHPRVEIDIRWHVPTVWILKLNTVPSNGKVRVSRGNSYTKTEGELFSGTVDISDISSDREPDQEETRLVEVLIATVNYLYFYSVSQNRSMVPLLVSQYLGNVLTRVRQGVGLTQEQLSLRIETSRIALSQWEIGHQPPSIGQLIRWCTALGLMTKKSPIVSFMEISQRLIPILRVSPEEIHKLNPTQFEQFVAERLDRMGYLVKLTGSTYNKDGGIDLIAIPKVPSLASFLLACQVKHRKPDRKVGRVDVDRLLAWKGTHFGLGLLVTNTEFTRDALWLATQNSAFLRLRDFTDLQRWLLDIFASEFEWREIPRTLQLAPGVTIDLPRPRIFLPNTLHTD